MSIGKKIKEKRILLGLTQEELANKLGYKSKSTINKIELGINDIPQSKVSEFARALNTTPVFLMGLEREKPKRKHSVQFEYLCLAWFMQAILWMQLKIL